MFGYATDEHETLMPLSHHLATALGIRLTEVRKSKLLDWVRPDGKTQVSQSYGNRCNPKVSSTPPPYPMRRSILWIGWCV